VCRFILTICIILSSLQAQPLHQRLVLDHVNIAVKDLSAAVSFFEDTLGFVVKPGRLHENSINNAHVKFKDGSSIELITATEPRDALSKFYLERIKHYPKGSAAFICLRITDDGAVDSLMTRYPLLIKTELSYADLYSFKPNDPRYPLFFIRYKKPVKDDPKYLYHWNGAQNIIRIELCPGWWQQQFPKLGDIKQYKFGNTFTTIVHFAEGSGHLFADGNESDIQFPLCGDDPIQTVRLKVDDYYKALQRMQQKLGLPKDGIIRKGTFAIRITDR